MSIALCHQPHNENDPLAVFVAKAGGIDPTYCGGMRHGELARIRELRRGLSPGAINKNACLTLEEMAERVHAEGFMSDCDIDHFIDLLERDVNACADNRHLDRVYRVDSQAAQDQWDSQAEVWAALQEEEEQGGAGVRSDPAEDVILDPEETGDTSFNVEFFACPRLRPAAGRSTGIEMAHTTGFLIRVVLDPGLSRVCGENFAHAMTLARITVRWTCLSGQYPSSCGNRLRALCRDRGHAATGRGPPRWSRAPAHLYPCRLLYQGNNYVCRHSPARLALVFHCGCGGHLGRLLLIPAVRPRYNHCVSNFTEKQQLFIAEYLVDLNATQAAIRAGYSPKTAYSIGEELLNKPEVHSAIQAALDARARRTEITQDRVLEELAVISFSSLTHYETDAAGNVTLSETAPPNAMRAVSRMKKRTTMKDGVVTCETEIALWDKPTTLQLTAKHLGMLTERSEQIHKFDVSNLGEDDLDTLERIATRLIPGKS